MLPRVSLMSAAAAGLSTFIVSASADSIYNTSVPGSVPSSAAGPIDLSFTGFAFEQASFYNYSFDESGNPNTFSQNLIKSVLERTGGTPLLRVGGTSGDGGSYDAAQTNATNYPADKYGPRFGAPFLKIGPSYFEAFKNFPGAKFEFMVPLWHQDLVNTVDWARAGLNAIGNNLYALEIGNEPNLYSWFTVSKYVDVYTQFETKLKQEFSALSNTRSFQALDTAWGGIPKLQAMDAFQEGLNQSDASLKQVGFHFYQGSAPTTYPDFEKWVLHSNTVNHLAPYAAQINYMRQNHALIGFALTECGDSLGSADEDLSYRNTLATAVWGVDFMLLAMSMGVDRVNFQQILHPGFAMWAAVESSWGPKTVRANFYQMPFVADFIGKSGNTKTVALKVPDDNDGKLAAYAAYDAGKLARVAVINVDLWRPEDGPRPAPVFTLTGLPNSIKNATIHHLNAPGGALATDGLIYRNLQWTAAGNGMPQTVSNESNQLVVNGGTLQFPLNATSAVMLEF